MQGEKKHTKTDWSMASVEGKIDGRTGYYKLTGLLAANSSRSSATHSLHLACTSFAFSNNGLMFSGVMANEIFIPSGGGGTVGKGLP